MISLVIAITNTIIGIVVGIVLMEIAFIVVGLNGEAYVKSLVINDQRLYWWKFIIKSYF